MGGWEPNNDDEPKNDFSAYGRRHHLSNKVEIQQTEFEGRFRDRFRNFRIILRR
jgi:hypothetical protein